MEIKENLKALFHWIKNKYISRKEVKSIYVVLSLVLYFSFVLNISFWKFVINSVKIADFHSLLFFISTIFFITVPSYWIFNILFVPYIGKPLMTLLLVISSATNYWMTKYGVLIDRDMIQNAFETNIREVTDLMNFSSVSWILITGVIPAIIVCLTRIKYNTFWKEIMQRAKYSALGLIVIMGIGVLFFKDYVAIGRNNQQSAKLINIANYTTGIVKYVKKQIRAKKKFIIIDENPVSVKSKNGKPNVFVFVLGETARAQNFSINGYEKDTNPLLSKQNIINFKNTSSCATATAVSVPCIFSSEAKKYYDAYNADYKENLLDLIQKSGYKVIWYENDEGCKKVCSRVATEIIKRDNRQFCSGDYCKDGILLEKLSDKLKDIKENTFIVLHTMGSHGPTYYKRYPDKFKVFTPACDTADIQNCSRDLIVNTYDNTILYTDFIISSAINELNKHNNLNSGLIYVSDHGESLGEKNIYLHGMPYAIAPKEQTNVPMIIWLSDNLIKERNINYPFLQEKAKTGNYSHDNIYHSMLGINGISSKTYDKNLDVFAAHR